MLLSVLIPTFNYDCTNLVKDLSKSLPENSELIVADDGSTDQAIIETNRAINLFPQCRFWEAPANMGRAVIRNRLAEMAQGEWLLFLDCDAQVGKDDFIENYLKVARQGTADVICGGTMTPAYCPSPKVSLRYNYERKYWQGNDATHRNAKPYDCFTTFNFLIRRQTFMDLKFNEQCKGYGHEDTLLGEAMSQKGTWICHIDNALTHIGLEDNATYLRKTEEGLRSLKCMEGLLKEKSQLAQTYLKLKGLHLLPLVKLWHLFFGRYEAKLLCSQRPCMALFNIYKLGYYSSLKNNQP